MYSQHSFIMSIIFPWRVNFVPNLGRSTFLVYFMFYFVIKSKSPEKNDENDDKDRKAKIKHQTDGFQYFVVLGLPFTSPAILSFTLDQRYWYIRVHVDHEFLHCIESDHTEGLHHGEDHPDIDHLYVGSHGE